MYLIPRQVLLTVSLLNVLVLVSSETFTVRIGTEQYINVVDPKFVSFTIDPKYLFASSEKSGSKESICMASSLTPAYLRIAGPSTSSMVFHNNSISIDTPDEEENRPKPIKFQNRVKIEASQEVVDKLSIEDEDSEDADNKADELQPHRDSQEKHYEEKKIQGSNEEKGNKQQKLQSFLKSRESQINISKTFQKSNDSKELKGSLDNVLPKKKRSNYELSDQESKNIMVEELRKAHVSLESLESQEYLKPKINNKERQESPEATFEESEESSLLLKRSKRRAQLQKAKKRRLRRLPRQNKVKENLEVSHREWKRFVKWSKDTGFDLVFALNNDEKTENGMWDPNPTLNILTVAEKGNVGDIFWQLGYECNNQTIEDYINDLETLRVIVDTFPAGQKWKVVGGDVTGCLQEDSKSDFKDYVTLSDQMMDAVMLNGNSSSHELNRLSPAERLKLLRLLSSSTTPLWLTEKPQLQNELSRAADWITSLGYSAKNGFGVHFRELIEEELYEPTLSFYMALLFKNLVGERVLDVTTDPAEGDAILFAHCTSLRHKPVPGAVTLYGVNMASEPARFSIKLSKREEGGDIMQFILGHDHSGNIVVNGRAMFYEGDIRPVVKRVRPYKTLLINLPPKSFGFWVLANTKIDACYDFEEKSKGELVKAKTVEEDDAEAVRSKRAIDIGDILDLEDESEFNTIYIHNENLKKRIDDLSSEFRSVFGSKKLAKPNLFHRVRRQIFNEDSEDRRKLRKQGKSRERKTFKHENKIIGTGIIEKLVNNFNLQKLNLTRNFRGLKERRSRLNKNKSKRHSKHKKDKSEEDNSNSDILQRNRRSVFGKHHKENFIEKSSENEVDVNDKNNMKYGKFFRQLDNEVNDLEDEKLSRHKSKNIDDQIVLKTKITDDDVEFKLSENADHGIFKSTFENVLSMLEELNRNLNKMWNALTFLD